MVVLMMMVMVALMMMVMVVLMMVALMVCKEMVLLMVVELDVDRHLDEAHIHVWSYLCLGRDELWYCR